MQLEPAELLAMQRWTRERVFLAAAQHVPGDHDEFACDGDCRDVRAAAGFDALMERAQWSGGPGCVPGCFDEQATDLAGTLFADPAVLGGLAA